MRALLADGNCPARKTLTTRVVDLLRYDSESDRRMPFEDDSLDLFIYIGLVPWDTPRFSVEEQEARLIALDAVRPIKVTQRRRFPSP